MSNKTDNRPQLKRDYKALELQAKILYIKTGLSADAISKQLDISMPTLAKWNAADNWQQLRPDMEILNQYKAAAMYVEQGMQPGNISQRLSISETTVNMWIDLGGWHAARLVKDAPETINTVLSAFSAHYAGWFPHLATDLQAVINDFVKKIS